MTGWAAPVPAPVAAIPCAVCEEPVEVWSTFNLEHLRVHHLICDECSGAGVGGCG